MGLIGDIKKMVDFFNNMMCLAKSIPKRIENVKYGVTDITVGSVEFISAVGQSGKMAQTEIFGLAEYIGIFIFSRLNCGLHFLSNFPKCILFYVFTLIIKLIYTPIQLGLWITRNYLNMDFSEYETKLWDKIYGYLSMIPYMNKLRRDCFICPILKSSVISEQTDVINTVFKKTIPGLLSTAGRDNINRGKRRVNESLNGYVRKYKYVK
jgi:hypothetical protein